MDLPDCPPGAEGYEDSVVEVPKKPEIEDECTKAEKEFQEHLNSLKIKLEDGSTRCMVERRGRDISGKWIYLCYPCAAVCSGESILQTHISGKKHKTKLIMKSAWPTSIFENHPFVQQAAAPKAKAPSMTATEQVLQKMAAEVDLHNKKPSELESKFFKYRNVHCHIQDFLDAVKAPIVGAEYLVEHPPEQPHYEPTYVCTLCNKQGHPRTIINHMTCFWHRSNYLVRHFPKASALLGPYRNQNKYREAVNLMVFRLAQRVEDKFGRMRPIHIDKEEHDANKEAIHQWISRMPHFSETDGATFEEVVDFGVIDSLDAEKNARPSKRDPSPPVVAAPKPHFNNFSRPSGRQERRAPSAASLSDVSDDEAPRRRDHPKGDFHFNRDKPRFEPYPQRRGNSPPQRAHRFTHKNKRPDVDPPEAEKHRPRNYEYKLKMTQEKQQSIEENLKKTLAYHEKNPEKHPLYPEEWKKFWNKRYKEVQAEGKDPSKHDFKPEWIVFWTARMKELYQEELAVQIEELYRRMRMSPPTTKPPESRLKSPERRPELRRKSPPPRRRSPPPRQRSPPPRQRSPPPRQRSPPPRQRSPPRKRSPEPRRQDLRRPINQRHSPVRDHGPSERHHSPRRMRSRSPIPRRRSPARTHISLEVPRGRSRSPLSQRSHRDALPARNRSPEQQRPVAPSLQTVLVSDDELKADDLSPWNSDNEIGSVGSIPETRSHVGSLRSNSVVSSRGSRARQGSRDVRDSRPPAPQEYGPPENIVATLRLLVALEDYLGSIGPKIVDLLTEALKMEKEKANSSEDLLIRETAVVLIETAKEKLKGAAQAGLVPPAATNAVRAAVVRAAATLHEADNRAKIHKKTKEASKPAGLPVAGVGEVDRAEIAQQMAAALIAQGKTDVSSEELAQLVDAVVGMAEAKKREADRLRAAASSVKPTVQERPRPGPSSGLSGTATALQMLQSAYDENDKKIDKEDAPDAMDGLSDSDLETLLKNFNELSAEEQHSLIAYLKKLEAKEPTRVERLRKYVSDAAASAPQKEEKPVSLTVAIESDDDDYTVEEVFQSATQKVKENQIRQELEVVKKSLEEHKPPVAAKPATPNPPTVDLTQSFSSATDLFAMVQASLKSTPAPTVPSVVGSNTQPRSFGDKPEGPANVEPLKITSITTINSAPNVSAEPPTMNFDNAQNNPYDQGAGDDNYNQGSDSINQGSDNFNQGNDNYNQSNENYNQGNDNYNQGNDNYNQGDENYNQGSDYNQAGDYMQDSDNYNQQNATYNQNSDNYYQGGDNYNRGADNYNFNQGNNNFNPGNDNYNPGNDNYNPGNDNYNPGNDNFNPGNNNFNQGNDNFNPGNDNYNYNQGNNFNQTAWNPRPTLDTRRPPTRGGNFGQKPFNQNNRGRGNIRPQNQNNFRGRGRGNRGGRGRGRGNF